MAVFHVARTLAQNTNVSINAFQSVEQERGVGPWPACSSARDAPLGPNANHSLDSNVPKVVVKVAGSGGPSLVSGVPSPVCFTPQSLERWWGLEGAEQAGGKNAWSAAALWMAAGM